MGSGHAIGVNPVAGGRGERIVLLRHRRGRDQECGQGKATHGQQIKGFHRVAPRGSRQEKRRGYGHRSTGEPRRRKFLQTVVEIYSRSELASFTASALRVFTTSPIEINPHTDCFSSSTGTWRKRPRVIISIRSSTVSVSVQVATLLVM